MQLFALTEMGLGSGAATASLLLGPYEDFVKAHVPIDPVPEPSGALLVLSMTSLLMAQRRASR